MNNIKLRLSFYVPGAQMLSSQECEANSKNSYDEHKMLIEYYKGKGKKQKKVKELISFRTRKSKLVTHGINITEEAYQYMLDTPPSEKLLKGWKNMPKGARLKAHFDLIAYDLKAESYNYEILED